MIIGLTKIFIIKSKDDYKKFEEVINKNHKKTEQNNITLFN